MERSSDKVRRNGTSALALVGFAALAFAATGCAVEPESDSMASVDEGEGASTKGGNATIPKEAEPYVGRWTVKTQPDGVRPHQCDDANVLITAGMNSAEAFVDYEGKGGYVALLCDDGSKVSFRDKPAFVGIGGSVTRSSIDMGGGSSLVVSHETLVVEGRLEHRATIASYKAWLIPAGSVTETQKLWIEGNVLHLTEATPGLATKEWTFERK